MVFTPIRMPNRGEHHLCPPTFESGVDAINRIPTFAVIQPLPIAHSMMFFPASVLPAP